MPKLSAEPKPWTSWSPSGPTVGGEEVADVRARIGEVAPIEGDALVVVDEQRGPRVVPPATGAGAPRRGVHQAAHHAVVADEAVGAHARAATAWVHLREEPVRVLREGRRAAAQAAEGAGERDDSLESGNGFGAVATPEVVVEPYEEVVGRGGDAVAAGVARGVWSRREGVPLRRGHVDAQPCEVERREALERRGHGLRGARVAVEERRRGDQVGVVEVLQADPEGHRRASHRGGDGLPVEHREPLEQFGDEGAFEGRAEDRVRQVARRRRRPVRADDGPRPVEALTPVARTLVAATVPRCTIDGLVHGEFLSSFPAVCRSAHPCAAPAQWLLRRLGTTVTTSAPGCA